MSRQTVAESLMFCFMFTKVMLQKRA